MPNILRHAAANWRAASRFVWGFGLIVRTALAVTNRSN